MLAPTHETYMSVSLSFLPRKITDSVACACLPGPDRFSRTTWIFFLVAHIIFSLTTYYRYYCIVYVSSHLQPNQILYCAWLLAWLVFVPRVYVCATAVLHIWRVRFVMDEYSLSCHSIIVVSFIY